jgi:O-antigen ligase
MSEIAAPRELASNLFRRWDLGGMCAWLLPMAIIAYLGLNNGGYTAIERSQVGIILAWGLLVVTLTAAVPLAGGTRAGRVTLAIFFAFAAWTALSLTWTDSSERTMIEVARVGTYAAGFALALGARAYWRQMLAGTATAIVVICGVALLSRLEPGLFPEQATGQFFSQQVVSRLAYPINYSSGLGALAAIGLPLLLGMTAVARTIPVQAAAAAALPACALTLWLTASGLAVPAAVLGLGAFLAVAPDRIPKLATLLVAAAGSAVLFAAEVQRHALDLGLTGSTAETEGDELLVIALVVCAGVGLVQVGISLAARHAGRPRLLQFTRTQALAAVAVLAVAALTVAIAAGAPGKASDAWDRFTSNPNETPTHDTRAGQILEFSSNGRYDFWRSAVDAGKSEPLTGIGAGTFEFWWTEHGDFGFVRDAHSLYFETFAELGIVGLLLIVSFTLAILGLGVVRALRAPPTLRVALAAATGGCLAFVSAALTDWMWELSVLPAIFVALAAIAVTGGEKSAPREASGSRWPLRAAIGAVALVTVAILVVNAMTLTTTENVQDSQALARDGQLSPALDKAEHAASVENFAASPPLQQALVLEQDGKIAPAAAAAQQATDNEPSNWRNWVVLSRLEARLGRDQAAVDAYRTAKSLNPRSPLFAQ